MSILVALLTAAVVILGVLVAGLLRSHAMILKRLHELGSGLEDAGRSGGGTSHGEGHEHADVTATPIEISGPSPGDAVAPSGRAVADIVGEAPGGDAIGVGVSGVEHDTFLAFLSSGCETCASFWSAFASGDPSVPGSARLVVVTKGADQESPAAVAELAPGGVTVVMSSAAWRDYEVPGSPYFVHVQGPSGTVVGEGTGLNWEQVSDLLVRSGGDLDASARGGRRVRKARRDAERERDTDAALLAAGFRPGDERLFGTSDTESRS